MTFFLVMAVACLASGLIIFVCHRWTVSRQAFWVGAVMLLGIWIVGVPYFLEST